MLQEQVEHATSTMKTPKASGPAKSKYEENPSEAQRKNRMAGKMQVGKNWILPKGVITKRKQRAVLADKCSGAPKCVEELKHALGSEHSVEKWEEEQSAKAEMDTSIKAISVLIIYHRNVG